MSLKLSLEEILRNLEQQVAFHREQAASHGEQEELHRSQRVFHDADVRSVGAALRRMREQGRIRLVREGGAVREGLYAQLRSSGLST